MGDVAELYQQFPGDDILNISMADGLSSTYNSAVAAADLCETSGSITVLNTRTLCDPHRFLVERAVELAGQCKPVTDWDKKSGRKFGQHQPNVFGGRWPIWCVQIQSSTN